MHYLFSTPIEDATLNTLSDLIERTVGVADLPLSTFQAPSVTVCAGDCTEAGESEATLSDSYKVAWQVRRRGGHCLFFLDGVPETIHCNRINNITILVKAVFGGGW